MSLRNLAVARVVFVGTGFVHAAEEDSISVRGGELRITGESGEMKLVLNGRLLRDIDAYGLSPMAKYAVGDTDIVLVMNNSGGTACPVQ